MKLIVTLLLLFSMPTFACLWSTETDLDGNSVSIEDFPPDQWVHQLQNIGKGTRDTADLAKKIRNEPTNLEYRNDYGVSLAQTGKVKEALQMFRDLETEAPGQYQTAANLGTVLELSGNDKEALTWIREAIKRNPKSHEGTEWLHVQILEAKLARAKDPNWLKTHTILGHDFGREGRPQVPESLRKQPEMARVTRALEYQLTERMSLVSAPDIYVGDLLFDLGNLTALNRSVERGVAVLQLSEEYGTSRPEVLKLRLEHFRSLLPDGGQALKSTTATSTPSTNAEPLAPLPPLKPPERSVIWSASPALIASMTFILSLLVWQRQRRKNLRSEK